MLMTNTRAATFLVLLTLAGPAQAADPVFPAASRIGLVPPDGMVASRAFPGFEDQQQKAALMLTELPALAYDELVKGFTPDALKVQGVQLDVREEVKLGNGPGLLISARLGAGDNAIRRWAVIGRSDRLTAVATLQMPETARATYSDGVARTALTSLVIRNEVPVEEQLAVLPFKLNNLAGLRILRVAAEGAALMTDGPKDTVELSEQSLFLISGLPGAPEPADRDRFARRAVASIPGLKEIQIVRAEPLRVSNGQGYEIVLSAKDEKTGTDISAVQWLRFGTTNSLRMVGVARKDAWSGAFAKFRDVRDGLSFR